MELNWRKLRSDFSKRRSVLARLWKPVGLTLSVLALVGWAHEFVNSHGTLTLPAAGFVLLACALLLATPVPAVRIAVLRALAFCTDLVLLAALTFSLLWLARASGGKIGGLELMVFTWLWFFYFVIWDAWFSGTAGKRFFGLRLRVAGRASRISLLRGFIRTALTLLVPLFVATFLFDALDPLASPRRFWAALTLGHTIFVFLPISIVLFGGTQGVVDRLLSTEIVPRRTVKSTSPGIPKVWVVLLASSLAWGLLFAWLGYLAYGRPLFTGVSQQPPSKYMTQFWIWDSPEAIATLWQHLPAGLHDPTSVLSNITIRVARPNPFTIEPPSSVPLPSWAQEFQELQEVQIIRLSFQPSASFLAKLKVIGNLAELAASQSVQSKPQYIVVEAGHDGDFGLFTTQFYETFLLRAAGPTTAYESLVSKVSVGAQVSLGRARRLLLGEVEALP